MPVVTTVLNPLPSTVLIPASSFTGSLVGDVAELATWPLIFSEAGDIDGDTYPELVLGGWIYEYPGRSDSSIPPKTPLLLFKITASGVTRLDTQAVFGVSEIYGTTTPRIIDLNNDGRLDFYYLAHNEAPTVGRPSEVFLNSGNGTFTRAFLSGPGIASHNSNVGDFNGDGYVDIIASTYASEALGPTSATAGIRDVLILYTNRQDGSFNPSVFQTQWPTAPFNYFFKSGSASAMGDFDGNGTMELVIVDAQMPNGDGTWTKPAAWLVTNIVSGGETATAQLRKLPDPYFDRDNTYAGFQSAFQSQSHQVKVDTIDFNNDGKLDIVVSAYLYQQTGGSAAGVFQFLENRGDFNFTDVTDATLQGFNLGLSASHQTEFVDLNGDGFLDIWASEGAGLEETDSQGVWGSKPGTHANRILINTGTGKFVEAMWDGIRELTLGQKNLAPAGWTLNRSDKAMMPYELPDGRIGFLMQQQGRKPDGSAGALVFDYRTASPLSTGPNASDPAAVGAPGFSEYFYLTEYSDVRAAVAAGTFRTGLDHYLALGRSAGRYAFAPNATLRGSNSSDTISGREGAERLLGMESNDILQGLAGNDVLDGGAGLDAAVLSGKRQDYAVWRSATGTLVQDQNAGRDGHDTVTSIERLRFNDASLALDLDGNAGKVAQILGAVFGKDSVQNPQYAGIGLHYLDGGTSFEGLMQFAINARLGPAASHRQIVDLLYTNVAGSAPSDETAQTFVGMLEKGTHTPGSLGVLAAETAQNKANIDLTGLAQTGLAYVEYSV